MEAALRDAAQAAAGSSYHSRDMQRQFADAGKALMFPASNVHEFVAEYASERVAQYEGVVAFAQGAPTALVSGTASVAVTAAVEAVTLHIMKASCIEEHKRVDRQLKAATRRKLAAGSADASGSGAGTVPEADEESSWSESKSHATGEEEQSYGDDDDFEDSGYGDSGFEESGGAGASGGGADAGEGGADEGEPQEEPVQEAGAQPTSAHPAPPPQPGIPLSMLLCASDSTVEPRDVSVASSVAHGDGAGGRAAPTAEQAEAAAAIASATGNKVMAGELQAQAQALRQAGSGQYSNLRDLLLDMAAGALPFAAASQDSVAAPDASGMVYAATESEVSQAVQACGRGRSCTLSELPHEAAESLVARPAFVSLSHALADPHNRFQAREPRRSTSQDEDSQEAKDAQLEDKAKAALQARCQLPMPSSGPVSVTAPSSLAQAISPVDVLLLLARVDPTLCPEPDALLLLTRAARLVLVALAAGAADVAVAGATRSVALGGHTMLARRRAMALTSNGTHGPAFPVAEGHVRQLLAWWTGSLHFTPDMHAALLRISTATSPGQAQQMYARLSRQLEAHAAQVATHELMVTHAASFHQPRPSATERQVSLRAPDEEEAVQGGPLASAGPPPISLHVSLNTLVEVNAHVSRSLMAAMGLEERSDVLTLHFLRACRLPSGALAATDRHTTLTCKHPDKRLKGLYLSACKELSMDREDCVFLWQEGAARAVLDAETPAELNMHVAGGSATFWVLPLECLAACEPLMIAHIRRGAEVVAGRRMNPAVAASIGAGVTSLTASGHFHVTSTYKPPGEALPQYVRQMQAAAASGSPPPKLSAPPPAVEVASRPLLASAEEAADALQRLVGQLAAKRDARANEVQSRLPLAVQQAAAQHAQTSAMTIARPGDSLGATGSSGTPATGSCAPGAPQAPPAAILGGDRATASAGSDMPTRGPSLADIALFVQLAPVRLDVDGAAMGQVSSAMDEQNALLLDLVEADGEDEAAYLSAQQELEAEIAALLATEARSESGTPVPQGDAFPLHAGGKDAESKSHATGEEEQSYGDDDDFEDSGYGDSGFEESGGADAGEGDADEGKHEGSPVHASTADKQTQSPYSRSGLLSERGPRATQADAGHSPRKGQVVSAADAEIAGIRFQEQWNFAVFSARRACRHAALDVAEKRLGALRHLLQILILDFDAARVYDTRSVLGDAGVAVGVNQAVDPLVLRKASRSQKRGVSRSGSRLSKRPQSRGAPPQIRHRSGGPQDALGALMHATVAARGASGPWAQEQGCDAVSGLPRAPPTTQAGQSSDSLPMASSKEAVLSGVTSVLRLRARRARERLAAQRAVASQRESATSLSILPSHVAQLKAAGYHIGDHRGSARSVGGGASKAAFISPYRRGQLKSQADSRASRSGQGSQGTATHGIGALSLISPVYAAPAGDLVEPSSGGLGAVPTNAGSKRPRRPKGKPVAKTIVTASGTVVPLSAPTRRKLRRMSPRQRAAALQQERLVAEARARQDDDVAASIETKAAALELQRIQLAREEYARSKRMGELMSSGHGQGALMYSPFRVGVHASVVKDLAAERGIPLGPASDAPKAPLPASASATSVASVEEGQHTQSKVSIAPTGSGEAAQVSGAEGGEAESQPAAGPEAGEAGQEPLPTAEDEANKLPVLPRLSLTRARALQTSRVGLLGMGSVLSLDAETSSRVRTERNYDVAGAIQRRSKSPHVEPLVYSLVLPAPPRPPGQNTFGSGHFEATPGEVFVYGADPLLTPLEVRAGLQSKGARRTQSAREGRRPRPNAAVASAESPAGGQEEAGEAAAVPGARAPGSEADGATHENARSTKKRRRKKGKKKKKTVFDRLYGEARSKQAADEEAAAALTSRTAAQLWQSAQDSDGSLSAQERDTEAYRRRVYDDYSRSKPDKYASKALLGGVRSMAELRASSGPLTTAGAAALFNGNARNSRALLSRSKARGEQSSTHDEALPLDLDSSALRGMDGVNGKVNAKGMGELAGSRAVMISRKERYAVLGTVYSSAYPAPRYPGDPYATAKGGKAGIHVARRRNTKPPQGPPAASDLEPVQSQGEGPAVHPASKAPAEPSSTSSVPGGDQAASPSEESKEEMGVQSEEAPPPAAAGAVKAGQEGSARLAVDEQHPVVEQAQQRSAEDAVRPTQGPSSGQLGDTLGDDTYGKDAFEDTA